MKKEEHRAARGLNIRNNNFGEYNSINHVNYSDFKSTPKTSSYKNALIPVVGQQSRNVITKKRSSFPLSPTTAG